MNTAAIVSAVNTQSTSVQIPLFEACIIVGVVVVVLVFVGWLIYKDEE